jgi:hypothetical protein
VRDEWGTRCELDAVTPTKSGDQNVEVRDVFVEITAKRQFPVSGFSGGWILAFGSSKRRVPEKQLRFGGLGIRV